MQRTTVVGTTAWGTTLAILLAQKGLTVHLLARSKEEASRLEAVRENEKRLPGISLPNSLRITSDPGEALNGCDLAIVAVPSQTMRRNLLSISNFLSPSTVLLSASKGLEIDSGLTMSSVMQEALRVDSGQVCVLSGPNLSYEIATGQPSATVVASANLKVAETVRDTVMTRSFRAYSSTDVVGVELAGALKNIVALGAGVNDGWGYGDNAKAAFLTRGLAEITRLGVAAGANPLTFLGLAGLGDLAATCSSRLSRNRRVGEELAKGRPLADILDEMKSVAEGIPTTKAAKQLADRLGVEMPITQGMYKVLYEGYDLRLAAQELMMREPKSELEGF